MKKLFFFVLLVVGACVNSAPASAPAQLNILSDVGAINFGINKDTSISRTDVNELSHPGTLKLNSLFVGDAFEVTSAGRAYPLSISVGANRNEFVVDQNGAVTSLQYVRSKSLAVGTSNTQFTVSAAGEVSASGDITTTGAVKSNTLAIGSSNSQFTVSTAGAVSASGDITVTGNGSVKSFRLDIGSNNNEFMVDGNGVITTKQYLQAKQLLIGSTYNQFSVSPTGAVSTSGDITTTGAVKSNTLAIGSSNSQFIVSSSGDVTGGLYNSVDVSSIGTSISTMQTSITSFQSAIASLQSTIDMLTSFHGILPKLPARSTVTASSCCAQNAQLAPLNSNVDGRWTNGSPQNVGQWYQIDLGGEYEITQFIGMGRGCDLPWGVAIKISTDPNVVWSSVPVSFQNTACIHNNGCTGASVQSKAGTYEFTKKLGRYIRLENTGQVAGCYWGLNNVGFTNAPPRASWSYTTGSSKSGTWPAALYDGDVTARVQAQVVLTSSAGAYITVDMTTILWIEGVSFSNFDATATSPTAVEIRVSTDASSPNWAGIAAVYSCTSCHAYGVYYFTEQVAARWIQVKQTSSGTTWAMSEFSVF